MEVLRRCAVVFFVSTLDIQRYLQSDARWHKTIVSIAGRKRLNGSRYAPNKGLSSRGGIHSFWYDQYLTVNCRFGRGRMQSPVVAEVDWLITAQIIDVNWTHQRWKYPYVEGRYKIVYLFSIYLNPLGQGMTMTYANGNVTRYDSQFEYRSQRSKCISSIY